MKIISIGDIHGRPFWKAVNPDDYDKIIFVGDYVDSFIFTDSEILNNLSDIIEFKKAYDEKVVLLLGNHDIMYMFLDDGFGCSGYRPSMASSLKTLFNDNKKLFNMGYQINNYLWTHAGVSNKWLEFNQRQIDEFVKKFDLDPKNYGDIFNHMMFTNDNRILHQVGKRRGGRYPSGGITWADRNETNNDYIEGYHQIVGHTPIRMIEKFGDDKGSIRYIDILANLEMIKDVELHETVERFYKMEL